MLAAWYTQQLIFDGFVNGLVFGLLAVGIVLVYRATRVINFAVGNMGVVGAGLFALLDIQYNLPFWLAAGIGLAVGVVYGGVLEIAVIRRLFLAPRVIVLVATIGIAQLSLAILIAYPEIDAPGRPFPQAIASSLSLGEITIRGPQLVTVLVVPLVAAGLGWLLTRTAFGKAVKASAENRDLARLNAISPRRVSVFVWAAAGALATISLSLIAAQVNSAAALTQLGPVTLSRALVAAVIAGLVSFGWAFAAGIAVGVAEALISFNWPDQAGLVDFVMLAIVLVAVYFQSRATDEANVFAFVPKRRPVPEHLAGIWWVRQINKAGLVVLLLAGIALPLLVEQTSRHQLYGTVIAFALCGLSLTVLTGWAGQLSLGQMAFAGIGALLATSFERGMLWDIGLGGLRFRSGLEPLPLGVSLLAAAAVTAVIAALIGVGALRVRGLLLAVSTFVFGIAAVQYLYERPILVADLRSPIPFRRSDVFGIDVTSQRSYYYVMLATLVIAVAVVGRLRRTGVGRSIIGVRDNPAAAAAYTISPSAAKLRAFAFSGFLAGLGGGLLAANLQSVPAERFFGVSDSLRLVSVVVIGGIGSVAGPVIGSLWVVGLPAFFADNDLVPLLSSSIGLLILLLYFRGGLVQLFHMMHDAVIAGLERRMPEPAAKRQATLPASLSGARERPVPDTVLRAERITVRFGGLRAVDDASVRVGRHEVVGLIGANGAGKTTLMNAISGSLRCRGEVELFGESVSGDSPSQRARKGLGRTFQAATLFPELSVSETVQLALEARRRSGFVSSALALPRSLRLERARRAEAAELIDFLGLGRFASAYVSDLSTGTRRVVELAGLLALDARMLVLDEPTGGLAQRETEAFGPLIGDIRRHLNASIMVIEHDMGLIMGISDRVYCLEAGAVIAEGAPHEVRNDPRVVAGYLGTDERAIARSGPVQ